MRTVRCGALRLAYRLLAWGVLFTTAAARAEPYELFAIYAPVSGAARAIEVPLARDPLLPDAGESHRLERIIARFKGDALSATTLSAFSRFQFIVSVGAQPAGEVSVETSSLEQNPGRDIPLHTWRGDGTRDALTRLKVEVRSIYRASFLCLHERELLTRDAREARPGDDAEAALGALSALAEPSLRPRLEGRKFLRAEGSDTLILYSFCRSPGDEDLNEHVPWEALARQRSENADTALARFQFEDLPGTAKGGDLRWRHKKALVERLASRLNQFPSRYGQSMVDTDTEEYGGALLFVRDEYPFSILKSAGSVLLAEETGGAVGLLADQIDQESEVLISVAREICMQLPAGALMQPPWFFELEVADANEPPGAKRVVLELTYRHGCTRVLAARWQDYLGQRVTLRVLFRLPGREDIVVYRDGFNVNNLGLITVFPVASELIAAAQGSSPRDIESTSVIPISWALSTGGDGESSYAVTFPFLLGLNTRSAPRLAEYIALAPSVSLIAGGEQEAPHFAFGIGVNLARAFHFGYAWAPGAERGQYVLLGVSIPELLPLLSGLGVSGGATP